jgi:hypothetical protein
MYAPNSKKTFSIFCELRSEDEEMIGHKAQHIQKSNFKVLERIKDEENPIKRCHVLAFERYGSPACDGNATVNR